MDGNRFDLLVKAATTTGSRRWAVGSILGAGVTVVVGSNATAATQRRQWTERQIIQIIYDAADRYRQPRQDMLRVARCESVLDPYAVNWSGPYYGLFQFLQSTFDTTPFAGRNIYNPRVNANAAGWMWRNGRRHEWACQ